MESTSESHIEGEPKEIIFATTNPSKVEMLQRVLGDEYKVRSLSNLGVEDQVEEDGVTPIENALKKAQALFEASGKPSFAMDFGFYIDGLPDGEQPGDRVKRNVPSSEKEPTDEEVLSYYVSIVKKLGGRAKAHWVRALAFVSDQGEFTEEIELPKILTDTPSNTIPKGYPLTAIQIDPKYNKYESEMSPEEKSVSHEATNTAMKNFVEKHF